MAAVLMRLSEGDNDEALEFGYPTGELLSVTPAQHPQLLRALEAGDSSRFRDDPRFRAVLEEYNLAGATRQRSPR